MFFEYILGIFVYKGIKLLEIYWKFFFKIYKKIEIDGVN